MRFRGLTVLAAGLALAATARPARAEIIACPFVGVATGGITDDSKLAYGGTLILKGAGIAGFAVDFGYIPDFLGTTGFGDNSLTTLQGNLVLMSPGSVRLYGSAGLGLVKSRVHDLSGLFRVDSNELGFNVGGGAMALFGAIGLQGDVRYFRNFTDPQPDAEFDVDLGGLSFWRITGGLVVRF